MSTVWFLYTCSLVFVALISCSISLAVWMATRRRDCLVSAAAFGIYVMELSLIFFDEYTRTKKSYPDVLSETLSHPVEGVVLSILLMVALWLWVLMRLRIDVRAHRRLFFAPVAVYALAAALLVPREASAGTVQQWMYWMARDLSLVWCLGFCFWRFRHAHSEAERGDLLRSKRFFVLACALSVCVMVEDTCMILMYRPIMDGGGVEAQLFWYLSERNVSENILMVACAIQLLRKNQRVLSMYFNHPPMTGGAMEVQPASEPDGDLESRVLLYCDEKGISAREHDVLLLVVRGSDTQNIASELVISHGTVKAHLHRIYRKIGVSNRAELIQDFWKTV